MHANGIVMQVDDHHKSPAFALPNLTRTFPSDLFVLLSVQVICPHLLSFSHTVPQSGTVSDVVVQRARCRLLLPSEKRRRFLLPSTPSSPSSPPIVSLKSCTQLVNVIDSRPACHLLIVLKLLSQTLARFVFSRGVPSYGRDMGAILESVDQGNGILESSVCPASAFTGVHCHYLSVRPVFPLLSSSSVSQCRK